MNYSAPPGGTSGRVTGSASRATGPNGILRNSPSPRARRNQAASTGGLLHGHEDLEHGGFAPRNHTATDGQDDARLALAGTAHSALTRTKSLSPAGGEVSVTSTVSTPPMVATTSCVAAAGPFQDARSVEASTV